MKTIRILLGFTAYILLLPLTVIQAIAFIIHKFITREDLFEECDPISSVAYDFFNSN